MPFDLGVMTLLAVLATQEEIPSYEYQDESVIEETLSNVMSRPEFRRLMDEPEPEEAEDTPLWLQRILDWLAELFGGTSVGGGGPRPGFMVHLVYAFAAAAVIAILFLIVKAVVGSSRVKRIDGNRPDASIVHADAAPGETPPEEFWTRAQALASRGQFKPAIRELLLGAMSAIERRGLIRHRKGLTNRDYYWAARGAARASLETIIATFELAYFGRREATGEGFRECAHAYQKSFKSDASAGGLR